jgi:hypothetical protein
MVNINFSYNNFPSTVSFNLYQITNGVPQWIQMYNPIQSTDTNGRLYYPGISSIPISITNPSGSMIFTTYPLYLNYVYRLEVYIPEIVTNLKIEKLYTHEGYQNYTSEGYQNHTIDYSKVSSDNGSSVWHSRLIGSSFSSKL